MVFLQKLAEAPSRTIEAVTKPQGTTPDLSSWPSLGTTPGRQTSGQTYRSILARPAPSTASGLQGSQYVPKELTHNELTQQGIQTRILPVPESWARYEPKQAHNDGNGKAAPSGYSFDAQDDMSLCFVHSVTIEQCPHNNGCEWRHWPLTRLERQHMHPQWVENPDYCLANKR
ncbi:hypothetical protein AOQ84DRAFT_357466 [Glonium stellatum]|uniref:Uncharacterized protein n=1 Tax=Glonium stellatum TaxID=574774 RepID=A0A8E2JML7_9PEZI|nr:hypothetical protein AOQ84DRAFT_357466 [Glonium stellatum]